MILQEALRLHKMVVSVVNDNLMDNHQLELARFRL